MSEVKSPYKREASPNLVIVGADWKPQCSEHGAMLKVSPNPACIYRCPTCGVGVDLTNTTEFIKWNLSTTAFSSKAPEEDLYDGEEKQE